MIDVRGVTFEYRKNSPVVKDVNLSIPDSTITALLGPNGAGKSTLLSLILGYLRPDKGSVHIAGRGIQSYSRGEMAEIIGFVSQTTSLPYNYPVVEYVLLGRATSRAAWSLPTKDDVRKAHEALSRAGIADLEGRSVHELSAGELQLAAIARCLCQSPRVLLMDEPTSHLDPSHRIAILRLLSQLSHDGLTVLITTHDPIQARQTADEVVLLKSGRVLQSGRAEAVLTSTRLRELYGVDFSDLPYRNGTLPVVDL